MAKNPLYNVAKLKDLLAMRQQETADDDAARAAMQEQVDGKSPMIHADAIAETAGLQAALDGKASIGTVAALAAMLSAIPVVRHNGSIIAAPRIFTGSVALVGGTATFDLTDGAGASIINSLRYAKAEVSDNTISYNYAYAIAADKKSLTVTVYRIQAVTLLGISVLSTAIAAPNGTVVNLFAIAE